MGEVWTEILSELDQEQVRPTTPDMEAVEAISRAIENRAEIVAGTQLELLEAQQSQDMLNEQEFYAEVYTSCDSLCFMSGVHTGSCPTNLETHTSNY